ncbi:MAG: hypothetical protein JO199_02245 [Candidatus Eremiobacteraeota bacterium]|nr:hypothetical protein [Candidatus Eremiobacteraeota bacterium]
MTFVTDMHFLAGFLVALCAIVFSWNALGRRVINAVLGLQILIGLVALSMHLSGHEPVVPALGWHVAGALAAALCYGAASAVGRRAGGGGVSLGFSIVGLVLVLATMTLGMRMFFHA